MAFTSATQRTHAPLIRALTGKRGQTLRTREIKKMVEELAPEIGADIQWLHPTDHCENHRVKGACLCAETDKAPLTYLSRGLFRVR